MALHPDQFRRYFARGTIYTTLIVISIVWTFPTVGLFVSSFRTRVAITSAGWWTVVLHPFEFTRQITFENYDAVLTTDGMDRAFLNSLTVAIPSTIIPILIAAFAAYGFAWLRFPGRKWLFALIVSLLVLPIQMSLIPVLRVYNNTGLTGTYLAVWLAHTGFGMPLSIYLLYTYIVTVPGELLESAMIDGASHFQIFLRIILPLSVPAIASLAIFQFLWVWNDFLVALVFLGSTRDVSVVTQRLAAMVGERGQDWHILTAGAFVAMILPLAVFFALQRYFVRGLMAGSVKG